MSDGEGPKYKDGDIVWVKLGSCWWPGEVTENGPEDFTSKKPPLAIVKFFNESTYEFVKSENHIYYYNCDKKNEFIRKGMDSFRGNNTHMAKFPGDVSLAEIRTDGNPNILTDPMFAPQNRSAIIAELFGSPSPKKTPKDNKTARSRTSKGSSKKPKVNITHRRFLGCDDYEAHIRVQYPGKDCDNLSSDEEIARLNAEPTKYLNCSQCAFNTKRLEVMFFHVQCHIKGITAPVVKKKSSPKKKRKIIKHITSDDDRTNSSTGLIDTDSDEEILKKPKRKIAKKPKMKKTEEKEEKPTTDIRTNLLAEWTDSEEEPAEESTESSKVVEVEVEPSKPEPDAKPPQVEEKPQKEETKDKSCFDFDEDEEEDSGIVHTAVGRKIPRVIPPNKRKSSDPDTEDASLPVAEDDENRMEILKENESTTNDSELAKVEEDFKDVMDSTLVPDLPEVPNKNFLESKAPKIPDKKAETSEVATKLTNPKKRFVKSFEDFEQLQNEQRRKEEEKEEELKKEELKKKDEQLKEKQEESKKEEELRKEAEGKDDDILEKEKSESPEPSVLFPPTGLPMEETSVTMEETSEPMEETSDPMEETSDPMEETTEPMEETTEATEETSEPMKEITEPMEETPVESEVIKPAPKPELSEELKPENLQISKLKCQVMSKLSDEEPESPRVRGKSHRSPRSKILESYRNDKFKEEKIEKKKEQERPATRKSKLMKYKEEKLPVPAEEFPAPAEELPATTEELSATTEELSVPTEELTATTEELSVPTEELTAPMEEESRTEIEDIKSETKEIICDNKEDDKDSLCDYKEDDKEIFNENKDIIKEVEALPEAKTQDEDLGKINQIDDYLNDFLFNFPKKNDLEEPKSLEKIEETPLNEVVVPTASEQGGELTIKTDESHLNNSEELSALSTLAMVSTEEVKPGPELVPIDGNPTVVSEKDLADGQVEITASKKPVTLTNFSMDFSECNNVKKDPVPEEMFDIEEHIPSQIVDKAKPESSPSKLLERLTEPKKKVPTKDSTKLTKTKFLIKPPTTSNKVVKTPGDSNKPIILSEKIIKPVKTGENSSVSVQKITSKRNLHDPDEIDTFIIQKGAKTTEEPDDLDDDLEIPPKRLKRTIGVEKKSTPVASIKKRGKAKILQQTIITPAGEIIQPSVPPPPPVTTQDDNVFDINSMPIVLSDQILTPESIENMPIYLSETNTEKLPATPIVKKPANPMRVINKSIASPVPKLVKTSKIITTGNKLLKQNSFASGSGKHGKYVIVTQPSSTPPTSKFTVGKKQTIIKRMAGEVAGAKVQSIAPEPTGNKIMILTDQQGQQQRVLLTPAQQKMMGYQSAGAKITKTVVKGNIVHKGKDGQMTAVPGSSGLISKAITPSRLSSSQLITSSGQVLTPLHPQQAKAVRIEKSGTLGRKIPMQSQKVQITKAPQQKTILIKNQHGQTVRKIQGTDDALLDKQVAEQLEAIKASGVLQQKQEVVNYKAPPKTTFRRSYAKKIETPSKLAVAKPKETVIPPLAPISPKKPESTENKQDRALHQLVIQDAMGNQTTITEGQILALPSETIDGQPQSYMLVTLDESGNLTPLNNEALLSLDPNLGLGGDLGNTVLQIDQSALKEEPVVSESEATITTTPEVDIPASEPEPLITEPEPESNKEVSVSEKEEIIESQKEVVPDSGGVMQTLGGDSGQQLIVTGDPIAAQKFLESLTEGNTDLANILASAEGSSILIHADGQQILINTDSDNQMLLSVNTDNLNMAESTEGGGNPIFATQPAKNQDILAAALADTDVFQQEQNGSQGKVAQLSPNSGLYPMNVSNVLETSLTLNSPIMTPLEVPSTNTKKISDETDILSQVPKNVDLPITITDPNISQTVSHQQVASLMVNELQSNLELSLPISDASITAPSSEMNSPSFVYSLPSLDGADLSQKPFNSSMPLLTEDPDIEDSPKDDKDDSKKSGSAPTTPEESFLDESEGLCTLGSEMCSSLSEPPPDMFDLSAVLSSHQMKKEELKEESSNPETASVTETSSPNTINEDSCEIPVQPEIVTTLEGVEKEEKV